MKYLFNHLNTIKKKIKGCHVILCLDFDGTLTPIVDTPEKAVLSNRTRGILQKLSTNNSLNIALISGRSLKNLRKKVGLKKIIYAGNHGLEIDFPGTVFKEPLNRLHLLAIKRVYASLLKKLKPYKGIIIEDKGATLSVHFRLAGENGIKAARKEVKSVTRKLISKKILKINPGKKVFEIKPNISWDKGKTVKWLKKKFITVAKNKKLYTIYIGDDATDNDAFRTMDKNDLTVYVGGNTNKFKARYYVNDVKEVIEFLIKIDRILN